MGTFVLLEQGRLCLGDTMGHLFFYLSDLIGVHLEHDRRDAERRLLFRELIRNGAHLFNDQIGQMNHHEFLGDVFNVFHAIVMPGGEKEFLGGNFHCLSTASPKVP